MTDEKDEPHRREALEWMIALQEQPDDAALRARFDLWRRMPMHDAAWNELAHVSTLIRMAPQSGKAAPSLPQPSRRWRRSSRAMTVPIAMAACLTAVFLGRDLLPDIRADAATSTGEIRTLSLGDGSRVTLAPHSAIAFDGTRHARLLRGSAYFHIRHDDANPFRVAAGDAVATDLGTAFEVQMNGSTTHIAVREGAVGASCTQGWRDALPLRPGETATLDCATGIHRRGVVAPSHVAAWTTGKLVIIDRPLAEAIAALRPWHQGWLMTRGPGMARHVTGVYDLRQPDRALAAMRQAHGLGIVKITPWITIVRSD
ncbi:FecR domain-containing protein [Sphingomonas sp.]|uniref:FecR family protein n=1 Tax=Sphingomonas sp. TaxID=28214 RepID=UPI0031CED056